MRSASSRSRLAFLASLVVAAACGGSSAAPAATTPTAPGANVLPLTVNGATCAASTGAYPNKPCVQVTLCLPGTATCATVNDVLVDTGSYGLRLFKEVLPFSPPRVAAGAGTLAECVAYLDGSSHWGPVATADVVLGAEPAIRLPIQIIDSTFGTIPSTCLRPETLATAGFNGILGVGIFAEDCGAGCAPPGSGGGMYFACTAASCTGIGVPAASQVPNPVARLPVDNNGVIVVLPPVAAGGQVSVGGSLVLGIDTQANNASTGATAYQADAQTGDLRTGFDGKTLGGFLDTGSNGLFFPSPTLVTLPVCAAPDTGWYCPASIQGLSATNAGVAGSPSGAVTFSIGNAVALFASPNDAFGELGGPMPGTSFDFGLPFFFGRKVFVGIEARASSLGAGPYYAY